MADNLEGKLPENATAEQAIKEIQKFGDDVSGIKKQQDELNKNYKNLIDTVESGKADLTKIERLKTDIVVRQDALDKKHAESIERLDAIETALKRPGGIITDVDEKSFENAIKWKQNVLSANAGNRGVTFDAMKNIDKNIVMQEYNNYQKLFEEYLRKSKEMMSSDNIKTLSVGVDPNGGYTVTPFMSSQIMTRQREIDPIRQLTQSMTISTDAWEQMTDVNQVTCGWIGETIVPTETTTPDLGKKRIPVHEMFAEPSATQQLLEDSAINVENYLANKVADRMGRFESAAFVTGDGIGKPRGFLTYANGTTWGTIERINMGAAATLTADGFVNIKYHMMEQDLESGTWLMNRSTVLACMLLKNGAGDYIWKPSQIALDPSSSILGLPVRMSTTMPAVAAGALSVVLANFKEAYMIVDRLGITVMRDPYTSKPFVLFYFRKRVGGDVINYDAIKIGVIAV